MGNKAKSANIVNKRYQMFWEKERNKLAEPWRIPNSPPKGWKDRIRASMTRKPAGERA